MIYNLHNVSTKIQRKRWLAGCCLLRPRPPFFHPLPSPTQLCRASSGMCSHCLFCRICNMAHPFRSHDTPSASGFRRGWLAGYTIRAQSYINSPPIYFGIQPLFYMCHEFRSSISDVDVDKTFKTFPCLFSSERRWRPARPLSLSLSSPPLDFCTAPSPKRSCGL